MFTFIYCFDKNYNIPAVISIVSLLDKVTKKINITIVHKNKNTFKKYENLIINHKNLNSLEIHTLNTDGLIFPNTKNKHVSEATYYRIYLDQVNFINDVDKCVYLDADIICLNNPLPYFESAYSEMVKNGLPLAARTEHVKFENELDNDFFQRNQLSTVKYFNAGLLLFNFRNWIEKDYFSELRSLQNSKKDNLKFWDQDLLNMLFDGNYLELNNFSNYSLGADWNFPSEVSEVLALFIHFQGKSKPWEISCLHDNSANFFQNKYREIFNKKVFLRNTYFSRDIKGFINLFLKLKIKRIKYPFTTLIESVKIILNYLKRRF